MLKKRRLRPLEDWKLAKQRRNCQQVHQQCFDCVYNSAGGFYTGRTLVRKACLLRFAYFWDSTSRRKTATWA